MNPELRTLNPEPIRMSILFVKHIDIEGPGTLDGFLKTKGITFKTVDVSKGESLPQDIGEFKAIVILGGPMNVYEEDKYPFLRSEDLLIKDALTKDIPIMGLCLGAQLIAKAVGASVSTAKEKEIGWYYVNLTSQGMEDPMFRGLGNEFKVFQWHGDTFAIPDNGAHLAFSKACANQVFRYNDNVYGLQFHLEVTKEMVREWLDAYSDEILSLNGLVSRDDILKRAEEFAETYYKQAEIFYGNFLKIAELEE